MYTLLLASASPARLQTLKAAGISTQVAISAVDEDKIRAELPDTAPYSLEYDPYRDPLSAVAIRACQEVQALATTKAQAILKKLQAGELSLTQEKYPRVIVGCDSMLEMQGKILGKPHTAKRAAARLRAMSNSYGDLYTGHCLIDLASGNICSEISAARVYIGALSEAEINAYISTKEPLEVAGSFTIDGYGGAFIERIVGDPHGVVGISLPLLRRLLAKLGYQICDFWEKN